MAAAPDVSGVVEPSRRVIDLLADISQRGEESTVMDLTELYRQRIILS